MLLMLLHFYQRQRRSDCRSFTATIHSFAGFTGHHFPTYASAHQWRAACLQVQWSPLSRGVIACMRGITELLGEGPPTLDIAAIGSSFLGAMLDPLTQSLDWGAVYTPFSHSKLSEVRTSMAGQCLAILKVEATEFTAGFTGWEQKW